MCACVNVCIKVHDQLDVESARAPHEPGSSTRRNAFLQRMSRASFQRIVRQKLKLHPFRCSLQPAENSEVAPCSSPEKKNPLPVSPEPVSVHSFCFKMTELLIRPRAWYRNMLVTEECWLTLGGHIMNRYRTEFNLNFK